VRDRLRKKVEEQFELVWSAFEAGLLSEDERARVAAAVSALDQAYGRPSVSIEGGDQPVAIVLGSIINARLGTAGRRPQQSTPLAKRFLAEGPRALSRPPF
jgi:hypothetical protein